MSSSELPFGYTLQEYSIEALLGAGGFGMTYLAQDRQLGTRVAIKEYFPRELARRDHGYTIVPLPGDAARQYEWGRQQFLKEAQALARFKHNNIVRVLRFLELNGTAYMIMEYETGQGLQTYIQRQGAPDERMLLKVFLPILNGLQAVHRAGLLHLDIKPDNIYLRSDGPPMLIDFGSARQVARTRDEDELVALTPAYAAIEQYPNQGKLGPWTDLYAIGASLYRCISGHDPVDAMARHQAVRRRLPDPLTPAVKLEGNPYSTYLRECIDWAMQIEPARRPQSAVELQDALMGKGVPNRKPSGSASTTGSHAMTRDDDPGETVREPGRRLDVWKLAQIGIVVLLVVVGLGVFIAYRHFSPQAEPVAVLTEPGPREAAPVSAVETSPVPAPAAARAQEAALASDLPTYTRRNPIKLLRTLNGHQDSVESLAFLANGTQLASGSVDGTIRIWNVENGRTLHVLRGHRRSVHAIAASPDGHLLVSAGNENKLLLWNPATGKSLGTLTGHDYEAYVLVLSPDGKMLASAGRGRTILLWDLTTRKVLRRFEGHEDAVLALAFSPDGQWLLSGGKDGQLKRWNVDTGNEFTTMPAHRGLQISAISISPDGKWIATAGNDDLVRLWLAESEILKRSFAQSAGFAASLVFSPDSRQLFAGGASRTVRVWDVSGGVDHDLEGHNDDIQAIALYPPSRTVASAGRDKTVRLWRANVR